MISDYVRGAVQRVFLGFVVGAFILIPSPALSGATTGPSLDGTLAEIQSTLRQVGEIAAEDSLPQLESVKLSLQTVFTKAVGGTLNFFVVTLGAQVSTESAQQLEIVLVPPSPDEKQQVSTKGFSAPLAEAIVSAARTIKNGQDQEPPLKLKQLVATIKFVVEKSGDAGAKFVLVPISPSIGGKAKSSEVQTITFSFGKK